jgi:hypothetical protein
MNTIKVSLLVFFCVIIYMIAIDYKVLIYSNLIVDLIKTKVNRGIWVLKFHPRSPFIKFFRKVDTDEIAKNIRSTLIKEET